MSWSTAYRVALHLLPTRLREKHGSAMEALFAREVELARERGSLYATLTALAGIGDVVLRSAYEQARPARYVVSENGDGPPAPLPGTAQLLRRHAVSFAIAFVTLTVALLALFIRKQVAELSARGAPTGTLEHMALLAIPFTAALTIPMAVFVAVLREFTQLGADGTLGAARRQRAGLRRLVLPVLAASAVVAALAFVEVAEAVPRANTELAKIMYGRGGAPSGRMMTLGELRAAERTARSHDTRLEMQSAAIYEVEIQKKFALPAACLVLAFVAIAIALAIPRGGLGVMLGASCAVFITYYLLIATGEMLATRLVISPTVGMWGANALLFALSLLAVRMRRGRASPDGGAQMIDG